MGMRVLAVQARHAPLRHPVLLLRHSAFQSGDVIGALARMAGNHSRQLMKTAAAGRRGISPALHWLANAQRPPGAQRTRIARTLLVLSLRVRSTNALTAPASVPPLLPLFQNRSNASSKARQRSSGVIPPMLRTALCHSVAAGSAPASPMCRDRRILL